MRSWGLASMSEDVKLPNVPALPINRAVALLERMYREAVNGSMPMSGIPSVMLWGPPGVGKSQGVRQLGDALSASTGKRAIVTDVRLLLFNPIDLRGIPTANSDKTLAIWLRPQIFQMDASNDVVNILFLDEISAAPQSVQAAAYQITLDRTVGEHRLPDNCIVMAAGNRVTDKSVAYKMPKALANRLLHLEIEPDFDSWKQWAIGSGVNEKVVGFLDFRRDYLMGFDATAEDLAFPTPRSWEMASNLLNLAHGDVDEVYTLVCGLVGTGAAVELRNWSHIYSKLPSIPDIFSGKNPAVPKGSDVLFALTSSMTAYARECKDDLGAIANSIRYADGLPPDFAVVLMKDYLNIAPGYRQKLLAIPEFTRWMSSAGGLMNGSV